jgi:iron-sulfur cluster insertion protein
MSAVETYQPDNEAVVGEAPVIITASAANKVQQLINEENNVHLKLRVFITGGGCSGFQYGFAFEEDHNEDDMVIKKPTDIADSVTDGIKVLIDPMSLTYLMGATIDYKEDLEGERFIIHNPNAQTSCGCGSSFAV